MKNVACAVLAFDRPYYFIEVLNSLKTNTLANEIDWYFFVDGPVTKNGVKIANADSIQRTVELIKWASTNSFKQKCFTFISKYNMGIAKQKQSAHKLFEDYEQVLFFEDDMLVSPYYIQLLLNMQNQFPDDMVYAPARALSHIHPDARLNHVIDMTEHLWGYSMRREAFLKIKDDFDAYCEDTGDCYKQRDNNLLIKKYDLGKISSHDSMIEKTLKRKGIRKICTTVPRGFYIGESGLHQTKQGYDDAGYAKVKNFVFQDDLDLTEFELLEIP